MANPAVESFVFYKSFYDSTKNLKDSDKLLVFNAIFSYAFEGKEPRLKGVPAIIWTLAKPNIDASISNRVNGRKGGRPKKDDETKRGVLKGGFKGGLKGVVKTNEDVNVDVDVDVDGNEDGDDSPKINPQEFSGETAEATQLSEWAKKLGVFSFSEAEKMAIKKLVEAGCNPEDACKAKIEKGKYFGKISGEGTMRAIVLQKDLREKPCNDGIMGIEEEKRQLRAAGITC